MVNNTRNVSTFWDEFDTGWLTPQINFTLFVLSFILGIAGFIVGAMV